MGFLEKCIISLEAEAAARTSRESKPASVKTTAGAARTPTQAREAPAGIAARTHPQAREAPGDAPAGIAARTPTQTGDAPGDAPAGIAARTPTQAGDARSDAPAGAARTHPQAGEAPGDAPAADGKEKGRTESSGFEKLRDKKSDKVHITDYIDRRKSDRSTDRRQNRRRTEGYNTLTSINLRKNFGQKEIVRGVGFSMRGGDVAGLLGPNGAGKTTIFYMIVGFYKPTTGDIKLNNVSIINGPMYRRARMGIAYLPQEASIFRKLTVEQNIWAILESRNDLNKKQKKTKLDELITEFGIGRIRKQYGYTLSGGERRRTEIARALAIDPKFLLLDEPFAGIDPMAVSEIKQIIKRLAENGIGVLITDHNVRDTLEITSDAFIINHGSIVARGNRDHILENKIVRDVYLGSDFKM
jgi:lipopolysaccharide export system ATP-binding protein